MQIDETRPEKQLAAAALRDGSNRDGLLDTRSERRLFVQSEQMGVCAKIAYTPVKIKT